MVKFQETVRVSMVIQKGRDAHPDVDALIQRKAEQTLADYAFKRFLN